MNVNSNYLSIIPGTIESVENFLRLAKQAKPYFTPEYRQAAKELCEIIDEYLTATQSILKWANAFEVIELNREKVSEFYNFYKEYNDFLNGPELYRLDRLPNNVVAIYKKNLDRLFTKWFVGDNEKLYYAQQIIEGIEQVDAYNFNYLYKFLTMDLNDEVKSVFMELREENYERARNIQKEFLKTYDDRRKEIRSLTDNLNNLLHDYEMLIRG